METIRNSSRLEGVTGAPEAEAGESMTKLSFLASRFTQGPNIQVLVGKEKQIFQINRGLLIHRCPYIASALKQGSVNDVNPNVELDVKVAGFEVFVDYIYSGQLPQYITSGDPKSPDWSWRWLAAYQVANILRMPDLQNDLIDLDIRTFGLNGVTPPPRRLHSCVEWGLTDTPYYTLNIRDAAWYLVNVPLSDAGCESWTGGLLGHPNILRDVIMHVNRYNRQPWSRAGRRNACEYHIHPDGKKCPSTLPVRQTLEPRRLSVPPPPSRERNLRRDTGGPGQPAGNQNRSSRDLLRKIFD